jgi:hypothetical protein
MNAPAPIHAGAIIGFEEERAAARRYAQAGKAPSTVAGYRRELPAFAAWCSARGLSSMPATTDTVILHITALADGGLSVSSIGRQLECERYQVRMLNEAHATSAQRALPLRGDGTLTATRSLRRSRCSSRTAAR